MKKCFYALAALVFAASFTANAAPGDTTWVQANNRQFDRGNGYGNYDTSVVFPSGAVTYRKIYMFFTLGKYACPGYNPSNPGEGATQTGWCSDWDYDIHNILMTPTDTFELGRLITPYANTNWPRTPLAWKQRYIYDVTDYYPVLKNAAAFRVFYSGYSAGFSGNIRFAFIEGTPERNVLRVDRTWNGSYPYGVAANPINTALGSFTKTAPAGTVSAEAKILITGHGGDNPNACAEFCPNTYNVSLNGNTIATQNFWRSNCGSNNLYPQSGTWIYNRANWCPGDQVQSYNYKLAGVTANSNYTLGLAFPPYTSGSASYSLEGAVMYYGGYNKTVDASIEDIIAPTNAEWHYRENPMVGKPFITVRNTGSATLTSIKFEYGVVGRTMQTYTWTGSLAALQNADIKLAELVDLKLNSGSYQFVVRILQANGAADGDTHNNEMTSTFTAAPMWPSDLIIQFQNNNQAGQTKWKITDMDDNVIREKSNCGVSALCVDTISLTTGKAYKLIVSDTNFTAGYYDIPSSSVIGSPHGDGLRFSGSTTSGYIRAKNRNTGAALSIPAGGTGAFEGNFGFGYVHYFYTGWATGVTNVNAPQTVEMQAFPNPASAQLSVFISGIVNVKGEVLVLDMFGRKVLAQNYQSGIMNIDVSAVANGVYQLIYTNGANQNLRTTQKIVITK